MRSDMITRVSTVVGSETAAHCLLTAFDIIYRKFIRNVLQKGSPEKKLMLHNAATSLSQKMFVSGANLYQNLLATETRYRKVQVELPAPKGGKAKTQIREEKYTARIKPNVLAGPRTNLEQTVISKINQVLAKTETMSVDYTLKSKEFASPQEWEDRHKGWVDLLYTRSKFLSNMFVRRKQLVRAIVSRLHKEKEAAAGQGQNPNTTQTGITPEEWRRAEDLLIEEEGAKFDRATEEGLNLLFDMNLVLDDYVGIPEKDLLERLAPEFRDLPKRDPRLASDFPYGEEDHSESDSDGESDP